VHIGSEKVSGRRSGSSGSMAAGWSLELVESDGRLSNSGSGRR
jgi:hypothetical protein